MNEEEIDKVVVDNIELLYGVKGYFDELITDELLLTFKHGLVDQFEHKAALTQPQIHFS